jgi:endonuclease YncB( thermonuclease family)
MWTRMIAIAGSALVLGSVAQAGSTATVGVVTAVDGSSVQLTARAGATKSLRLDGKSQFVKWITHQPWQQDNRADRSKLTVGRCVQVESQDADASLVRLVRINLDDVETMWSPCREIAASLR